MPFYFKDIVQGKTFSRLIVEASDLPHAQIKMLEIMGGLPGAKSLSDTSGPFADESAAREFNLEKAGSLE